MKMLVAVFAVLTINSALARLDESSAQIERRYGSPFSRTLTGMDFFHGGYIIETIQNNATTGVITYQKTGKDRFGKPVPLTPAEVHACLNQNIKSGGWDKSSPTEWTCKHEKKSAFYVKTESRLYVFNDIEDSRALWDLHETTLKSLDLPEASIGLDKWKRIRDAVTEPKDTASKNE